MEYSVTVWRTPVRESKEVLYRLTYRREWVAERGFWRDTLAYQTKEKMVETASQFPSRNGVTR